MKKSLFILTLFLSNCYAVNDQLPIVYSNKLIKVSPSNLISVPDELDNSENNIEEKKFINANEITSKDSKGEIKSCGTLKDNLSNLSTKCVNKIAVNKDFVYFTSYSVHDLYFSFKSCEDIPKKQLSFIYQIDKDKKLDVVKTSDNKPIYKCNNWYDQIQTNTKNELFFNDYNLKKIFNGNITNLPDIGAYHNFQITDKDIYYMYSYADFHNQTDELIKYDGFKKEIISNKNNNDFKYLALGNDIYILALIEGNDYECQIIKLNSTNRSEITWQSKYTIKPFKVISTLKSLRFKEYVNTNLDSSKDYLTHTQSDLNHSITQLKANSKGEFFFNDLQRNIIWKVTPKKDYIVEPVIYAGSGMNGYRDGKALEAKFNYPSSFDFDEDGRPQKTRT